MVYTYVQYIPVISAILGAQCAGMESVKISWPAIWPSNFLAGMCTDFTFKANYNKELMRMI